MPAPGNLVILGTGGIGGEPLQAVGGKLQPRLQSDGLLVVGDRLLGAPLRLLDLAFGPQHVGAVGIELLGRLGILDADVGLAAHLVDDGPVGEGERRARIEFDGVIEVGERLLVRLRDAVGEPACRERARRARIERRRLREILQRRGDVVGGEVGLAAQQIELGVAGVEGDGARQILDGIRQAHRCRTWLRRDCDRRRQSADRR